MKNFFVLFIYLITVSVAFAQDTDQDDDDDDNPDANMAKSDSLSKVLGKNGFTFKVTSTNINSPNAEFGSGVFRDKFVLYSGRRLGGIVKKDEYTGEPLTKLFCADMTTSWNLENLWFYSEILNRNDNLGIVSFTADFKEIYFSENMRDNPVPIYQIFHCDMNPKKDGKWINEKLLPFCKEDYSYADPHLNRDGTILYFSSNEPGGKGGYDLYQVDVREDGSYGPVTPVPGNINTEGDEKHPQTSPDNKYLYFSSNGRQEGIGGFDLYVSKKMKAGYVNIVSLGNTINTHRDELSYIPINERIRYMTSNRDEDDWENYDIFTVEETNFLEQYVSGVVRDENEAPVEGANVTILDSDGTKVDSTITASDGVYRFKVDPLVDYTVNTSKENFTDTSVIVKTNSKLVESFESKVSIPLKAAEIVTADGKSFIKIDNILFEYNSSIITDDSKKTLNSVVKTLEENPELKVAINAHTDSRGSGSYNLKLSSLRAASAKMFLIKKGISAERLISKGFGETQPIHSGECTEKQHQDNRRIEFLII